MEEAVCIAVKEETVRISYEGDSMHQCYGDSIVDKETVCTTATEETVCITVMEETVWITVMEGTVCVSVMEEKVCIML